MLYCLRIDSARQLSALLCQALIDNDEDCALKLLEHPRISQFINIKTKRNELQNYTLPYERGHITELSPMFIAITVGSFSLLKGMIAQGASLQNLTYLNDNALHVVCHSKIHSEEKCEYLIRYKKTLIDRVDIHGNQPLHTAACIGNSDICDVLIKNRADVNAKGFQDKTPLEMATVSNQPHCVSLLLERGANILARAEFEIAFETANKKGFKGISQYFFF